MSYKDWFDRHGKKHVQIVAKLSHLSDQEIVEYFCYDNMRINEPDFCPLYAEGKKCHDMEHLNCYLCACPYFRFDDDGLGVVDGKSLKSICSIDAKDGAQSHTPDTIHQSCTHCTIPHHKSFIMKHFSRDWFEIMKNVTNNQKALQSKTNLRSVKRTTTACRS